MTILGAGTAVALWTTASTFIPGAHQKPDTHVADTSSKAQPTEVANGCTHDSITNTITCPANTATADTKILTTDNAITGERTDYIA